MSYQRVTSFHVDLLLQEVDDLEPNDREFVLRRYDEVRVSLKKYGMSLADRMLDQMDFLTEQLKADDRLTKREQDLAVAAIKYFLKVEDAVPDDYFGCAGLVDDAMVVQAAINELEKRT